MRERGFRAAWRFYRQHFRAVFALSFVFYLGLAALAGASTVELGYLSAFVWLYLIVVSIFWLQAPLTRLMEDVREGRPRLGARQTLAELGPRLGSITGGSFLAAVAVYFAASFFLIPGLFLLARWALLIPAIVLEGRGAMQAFGRSNQLVRGHTWRVLGEVLVSGVLFVIVWSIAFGVLSSGLTLWAAVPLACAVLALGTPVIPLMRVLSYYDLREPG
ncbi:MAG TPA: glycerophosphoryl diester phosphodiesterase membrane domain-containing protein [Gaiellaceae bacterium]